MAILQILEFPDLRLRKKADPVSHFDDKLRKLIKDMFETMYAAPGIGLAATQVNTHKRLVVIDVSEEKDTPQVFINPQLTVLDETLVESEEGCLSIPGFYEPVLRAKSVRIKAMDENGSPFELQTDGLLATCIQHETDHLEGKLFVDYLSALKRQRIRSKLLKEQKKTA